MSKRSGPLAKFAGLPMADKSQIVAIFWAIILVRGGLSVIGYNRLSKMIPPATTPAPDILLRKFGSRVPRLARFVPKASCLTQAVAAQLLLARRGYTSDIRVGVRRDESGTICAHAWLIARGEIVLGGHPTELQSYAPLVDLSPRAS